MKTLGLFSIITVCLFSKNLEKHIQDFETPIVNYLKSIEVTEFQSGIEKVDCIYVINLDERPEKWERVKQLFDERGLRVNRVSGINGWKLPIRSFKELSGPYQLMREGHYGCLLSHISILKDAYDRQFDLIWIMEDDVEFIEDIRKIPNFLEKLTNIDPDWDVFFTDGDFRNKKDGYTFTLAKAPRPDQELYPLLYYMQRISVASGINQIRSRYGTHSMLISKKGIEKLLYYFTHVYICTPIDIDMHYVPGIKEYAPTKDIVTNKRCNPNSDTSESSSLNPKNKFVLIEE